MIFRILSGAVIFLLAAAYAPVTVAHADLIPSGLVDPPIFVTNKSGEPVTLAWQTSAPGVMLSPPRQASIPANASNHRIEPGLFWVMDSKGSAFLENVVYLSIVDKKGGFARQTALKVHKFVNRAEAKRTALEVMIAADGEITAVPKREE